MKTEPNESLTPLLKYRQEYEDRMDGDSLGMVNYTEGGLTIRAYIATKAMQGILANAEGCYTQTNSKAYSPDQISKLAVQHADALIKQLNAEK